MKSILPDIIPFSQSGGNYGWSTYPTSFPTPPDITHLTSCPPEHGWCHGTAGWMTDYALLATAVIVSLRSVLSKSSRDGVQTVVEPAANITAATTATASAISATYRKHD